jgi:S1-C subfamily serine protease
MTDLLSAKATGGRSDHTPTQETETVRLDQPQAAVPPPPPSPSPQRTTKRGGWRSGVATAAIAAVVGAGVAAPVALALDEETAPVATTVTTASGSQTDGAEIVPGLAQAGGVAAIASEVMPSVALVEVAGPRGQGSGSAVVYRADGYLLTNNHVVENAAEVNIVLPDGTENDAEVVGTDPRSDLAVLRVDRDDLPVPDFAAESPGVGDTAVAIGAPFGLDGSVTAGIVSALGRSVSTPGAPLVDLVQTDAPINPGNSGGALVDADGRVTGINTAILSPSGGNNGIGFAIPMATAQSVADQLIEDGTVEHAFLGVRGTTVDPRIAEQYALSADEGAVVSEVTEGSPAAEAGLQQGDIIISVAGGEVSSMPDLVGRISAQQPGDTIELEVVRGGETLTLEADLGDAPSND